MIRFDEEWIICVLLVNRLERVTFRRILVVRKPWLTGWSLGQGTGKNKEWLLERTFGIRDKQVF